ncbi:DUF4372 domain-containing protein [Prevotella copri]|uniref:DUF4372 domain-containing protein n=1 Tax=Segatella copri TaxID=165179 RepID=UPI001C3905FA|nr:DUF4372 domain-containing protein [Segatella copri]
MNKDKYVFAQLIEFLDNNKFRHLVDKYDGKRYVKHFTCWNQLLAMMFGQLSNRESLRDLFFKWLKQHLKIKKFWGTTENAARIQISSAIIAYCPVAIVQHDLQLKRSTYEALQILSISLMDKTPLVDFFERTDFNNVKELDCPLFPGLFD